MKNKKLVIFNAVIFSIIVAVFSCKKESNIETLEIEQNTLTPYNLVAPSYFPQISIPADNLLTVEGIALGRKLYYDTILSNTGLSCSSCHTQAASFTNPIINSMAHVNLGWSNKFLWNGSVEGRLEDAMLFEVEDFFNTDINKLNSNMEYRSLFKKIFKTDAVTTQQIAYALAQFIRTQISSNSKFDRYLRYETMLSSSEINGFVIYNSEKGDCFHCHSLGLFNDNQFHNIGLDSIFVGVNKGRYNVTQDPDDLGKFKTPTLRNVELTAPYMHDGRFASLEDVVEHYNSGVNLTATLDPILTKPNHQFGLQLTVQEKQDLIAFLKTLTDTAFVNNPELSEP
ncbi:MAG: c-type cytochrome [Bacteroidia bacterium]|nr:c-type cytochrome [Bacteroidia bacterium]